MADHDRKKRRFEIIDMDDGQKIEGYGLIIPSRAPHPYKQDGVQVNQIALRDLAINPNLSKRALRIAVWLISQLRPPPTYAKTRQEIARALDMHKSDVSKGLQELFALGKIPDENGVLYRPFLPPAMGPLIGVRPSVAWKGRSGDLVDAIANEGRQDEQIQERLSPDARPDQGNNSPEAALDQWERRRAVLASSYPPLETLAIIKELERAGIQPTLRALMKKYPKERCPSDTTLKRNLSQLEDDKLIILTKGKGRTPSVYSAQIPSQDDPSQAVEITAPAAAEDVTE